MSEKVHEILNVSADCPLISGNLPNFPIPEHSDLENASSLGITYSCDVLPGCSTVFGLILEVPINGLGKLDRVFSTCPLRTGTPETN